MACGRRSSATGLSTKPLYLSQRGIVLKPDTTHTARFSTLLGKQQVFSSDRGHRSFIFLEDFYRLRAWCNVLAGRTIPTRTNE